MSRASEISTLVFGCRFNEAIYNFAGINAGDGASAPSTKDVEDNLRAKGFVNGREFRWISPLKLQVSNSSIDRDLLDSILSRGGAEDIESSDFDDDL
jgi:hypothetical protein